MYCDNEKGHSALFDKLLLDPGKIHTYREECLKADQAKAWPVTAIGWPIEANS
jgi:hypothetical protein